jgi:predicted metal-dependent HD superfamily phosphohydrolase
MLKETYIALLMSYTSDDVLIAELWDGIAKNYSGKKRYYHTLQHLENVLVQLNEVRSSSENWDAILFALYYHDMVYNVLKSNNEEKSAALAETRMQQVSVPAATIERCKEHILATKSHITSIHPDTNYFTDADLSVLGQSWTEYSLYYKNVRKEYSIYPDLIYNPGRKKVLLHFLQMKRIYKTDHFYNKFEVQAKQNLSKEFELL